MSHRPSHRVSRSAATVALLATLLVLPGFADDESVHESKAKPDAYGSVAGKVDAHKQGQRAEKLFAAGEREHALAAYREWLALDPDSGLAHARMGYLLIGMGELEEATGHLERQVELGHRPAVGTYNLACAAALSGDTATAEKALLRAVRLGFADAELLAKDGDLDAIRGSEGYEAAVALVDQANTLRKSLTTLMPWSDADDELALQVQLAQIVTGDGKLQHEVGYALISAGQLEPAATAFERQAAAGYKPANALYNTACVRARMGDTEGAFAALEESARLGMHYADIVDDTDLDSLRGDSRFEALSRKIGASDEPSSAFKQALKEGDAEKAVAILDAITAEQLDTPATKELASWGPYELGSMALAQEQPERALQCFHRALEAGYAADQTVFQMAKAYARIGEQELALQHLDDALTLGYAEPRDVQELVEASTFCDAETGARLVAWAEKIAAKKKKQEAWAREEEEYARTAEKAHVMEDGGTR